MDKINKALKLNPSKGSPYSDKYKTSPQSLSKTKTKESRLRDSPKKVPLHEKQGAAKKESAVSGMAQRKSNRNVKGNKDRFTLDEPRRKTGSLSSKTVQQAEAGRKSMAKNSNKSRLTQVSNLNESATSDLTSLKL